MLVLVQACLQGEQKLGAARAAEAAIVAMQAAAAAAAAEVMAMHHRCQQTCDPGMCVAHARPLQLDQEACLWLGMGTCNRHSARGTSAGLCHQPDEQNRLSMRALLGLSTDIYIIGNMHAAHTGTACWRTWMAGWCEPWSGVARVMRRQSMPASSLRSAGLGVPQVQCRQGFARRFSELVTDWWWQQSWALRQPVGSAAQRSLPTAQVL